MARHVVVAAMVLLGLSFPVRAEEPAADTPEPGISSRWGGFLDTYYAWDFNRPFNFDRAYTTQPARHAEFNVNLVFLEAKISGPRIRGRVAVQWGTSVQANYAGEPQIGAISGPSVSQYVQEATVGYRINHSLWVDGGIFPAHLGYESWISRDNLTYTRSLVAEFSPYYEAGLKLSWAITPNFTAAVAVVNGWQNISVDNTPPAAGLRLDWALNSKLTISYDNFVGNMATDGAPRQVRFYQDAILQFNAGARWQLAGVVSHGLQGASTTETGTVQWWGAAGFAKLRLSPQWAVVGRVEQYSDPHQIVVKTDLPDSFQATGASIGVDIPLGKHVLWRSEARGFHSPNAVWPTHDESRHSTHEGVVVTSLGLSF
jgi:hypothetical protein